MDTFLFDAPRRTGPVLDTVAAQLPNPDVAVLDLLRVQKAPPKQSALFHAALIRGLLQLSQLCIPTPAVRTVSEDTCGGGGCQITSPMATASATPFFDCPGRQTGFPFLNSQAVRPDWCPKDTDGDGGGPISSPIWPPPPPPCSPLGLLPDPGKFAFFKKQIHRVCILEIYV